MDKKTIIDKVVKLLALSENNSNTAEAKSAKDMAAKLMAKHDISIIEAKEKPVFNTFNRVLTRLYPIDYDSSLIQVISSFNGVAYLIRRGINRGPNKCPGSNIFCGSDSDMEVNDYMLEVVFQQRLSAWKKHNKEHGPGLPEKYKKRWMFGFMFGIRDKLDELTKMKENKIQEHGLVPVDQSEQALEEYKKNQDVKQTKSRPKSYSKEGYDSGKNAHIHKGLCKQSDTKMIGV